MSSDHLACLSTGSTLRPISLTPRLSNSGFNFARAPSSVVQTGVKSFGCENKTAQELPIQSWNRTRPSVVSASKSGAVSPIFICFSSYFCLQEVISNSAAKVNLDARPARRIYRDRYCHPKRLQRSGLCQLFRLVPQLTAI